MKWKIIVPASYPSELKKYTSTLSSLPRELSVFISRGEFSRSASMYTSGFTVFQPVKVRWFRTGTTF